MPPMSGGGSCGGGWGNGVWVLGVDWNKWVAVRGAVGMGLVVRFEAQRVVRRVERGEAVVVVMRLTGGSLLR